MAPGKESETQRKPAFLFSGQATQYVGMGRDLYCEFPIFRETIEEANEILDMDIHRLCDRGPMEELVRTENTQPVIYAVSMGICRILAQEGVRPSIVAGHSVGEYTALVAGGAMDFATGCRIVRARGLAMALASRLNPGGMVSVTGLSLGDVDSVCRDLSGHGCGSGGNGDAANQVVVACENSPYKVVVSGHHGKVAIAREAFRELGAVEVADLPVAGAFHSPLMDPARERLDDALGGAPLRPPEIPVLSNVTGLAQDDPAEVRSNLLQQLTSCVRWSDCVSYLLGRGVRSFVEIGPGRALGSFVRHHEAPDTYTMRTDSLASISQVFQTFQD